MLKTEAQIAFYYNPQKWNKYIYVLNNPLRLTDPSGLIDVPVWKDLDTQVRSDLASRLGKNAEKIWNSWSNDQRQDLLNFRAEAMSVGLWDSVTAVFSVNHWFEQGKLRVSFDDTGREGGWILGFTTDLNSRQLKLALEGKNFLAEAPDLKYGWPISNPPQHPEGEWTMKQRGDDIILHIVGLKYPFTWLQESHFDGGGGKLTLTHSIEVLTGTSPTKDNVTAYLLKTNAGQYLRGISPKLDKELNKLQK
jgi:hypothetical protein